MDDEHPVLDPRYVFFHAFKGGTGRTYTVANVANYCARAGLHVVIVDLDVEAPGIGPRYGIGRPFGPPRRGFVDYAREWLQHNHDVKPELIDVACAGSGSIRVLVSGDPFNAEYWQVLVSEKWTQFLEDPGTGQRFWHRLQERLDEGPVQPDLVLLDGRAGLAELSTAVVRDLNPRVMSLINRAQPESPAGTKVLLGALVKGREDLPGGSAGGAKPGEVGVDRRHTMVGLVRRPSEMKSLGFTSSKMGQRVLRDGEDLEWLRANFGELSDNLMVINWDLEVDLRGDFVVPPVGNIQTDSAYWPSVQELAATFVGRELSVAIEPADAESESQRPVKWFFLEDGQMRNSTDGEPNLSFRVTTFRQLLDKLWEIAGSEAIDRFGTALEVGGRLTGKDFGRDLAPKVADLEPDERIDRWCDFDSAVGFGRMRRLLDPERGSQVRIAVENNAFAAGRAEGDHDLCRFLTGYIAGVLGEVLGAAVSVQQSTCQRSGGDRCIFEMHYDDV